MVMCKEIGVRAITQVVIANGHVYDFKKTYIQKIPSRFTLVSQMAVPKSSGTSITFTIF